MAAVWYRFRSTFRRRAKSYLGVVVLLGLLGGVAMASLAGARRTASAYPRFREAGNPSDIQVNVPDRGFIEKVNRLPNVTRTASYAAFFAYVIGADGKVNPAFTDTEAAVSVDGLYFDQDRFAVTSGRGPDRTRTDEVAVNEQAARAHRLTIGQRIELGVWNPALEEVFREINPDPDHRVGVTVVGIGSFNDEVVQDDVDLLPRFLLTPAFAERYAEYMGYIWTGVQLRRGDADVPQFRRDYAAILPEGAFESVRVNSVITAQAQRAVRPLAVALGTFGTLCVIATLLLAGQALARLIAVEREDLRILRAVGSAPVQTGSMALPGPLISVAGGVALSAVVALLLSPLTPIGPVRRVEVDAGFSVDWTVVGLGGMLLAAALILVALGVIVRHSPHRTAAWRAVRDSQPSATVSAGAAAGLPVTAVAGIRLALEPGAGRTASPVRATMAGAVVAVVAVAASLVFGSSLRSLVNEPRLYGWDWDVTLLDDHGYGTVKKDKAHEVLDHHTDVAAWSGVFFGFVKLGGHTVPAMGVEPNAAVSPPLLSGRKVMAPDEVVLGRTTLEQLSKKVGDSVSLTRDGRQQQLRIVGTAAMPTVGITRGAYTSLGVGAALPPDKVGLVGSLDTGLGNAGGNALFIRLREGVDRAVAMERLAAVQHQVGEFPDSAQILPVQRPAAIVNYDNMGSSPVVLATGLALAVLVSLGFALATGVRRRRRDLAVLKALGFTRRQLSATVSWQATITVAVGVVAGVPLGVALGRWLWLLFADQLSVVARPTIPVALMGLLVVALIVLANIVAAVPAAVAARTGPAPVLRSE